jgi:glycosyltransferase involved in cell wall biosynthesis
VRQSNACIAAGRKSAAFLKYLGAKEEKVFLAPNASIPKLKDEQIQLSTLPESIFRSDMIKILCLGRIIESKGLDFLIKAFNLIEKECSRTILIIAGDGPYSRQIENLGRQENIKKMLFVKQYMNSGDKIRLFQNCDIFVLPSVYHGYVDAWGLVLNEAMYFGKPVVATEMVGAAHDLIENGINGYIVPEKNAEALSEALIKIIHDDQLRKSMGLMSKQIIERRYKVSHMVKGFEDAINFVLSDVE